MDDITCPVCLDIFILPSKTECGHTFCQNCLDQAVASSKCCPLCRYSSPHLLGVGKVMRNEEVEEMVRKYCEENPEINREVKEKEELQEMLYRMTEEDAVFAFDDIIEIFEEGELISMEQIENELYLLHYENNVEQADAAFIRRMLTHIERVLFIMVHQFEIISGPEEYISFRIRPTP